LDPPRGRGSFGRGGLLPASCKVWGISVVQCVFSALFGRWQQRCGLLLSVLQQAADRCCQIEIQRMLAHTGLNDVNNCQIVSLLSVIVQTPWDGQHSCTTVPSSDCVIAACTFCEFSLLWYQLSTSVLQFVVSASESPVPVQDVPAVDLLEARAKSAKNAAGKR